MRPEMSTHRSLLYYFCCSLFVTFILMTQGCVAISLSSSGVMPESLEVERIFNSGTFLTDHIYYTDGSPVDPDVIIAINKEYQLRTNIWSQRDWTEEDLKKAVFWMQTDELGFCRNNGGPLIAPDGQQVGIWYSRRGFSRVTKPAPGIVEVFPFEFVVGSPCYRQALRDEW